MTIDAILQKFERFGIHLGLERIQHLLAALGNPQQQVPIIHVAGSNGKGSVCAYLSAVLTAAGYRVGRYISPHLLDWTERICLNEQPISESQLQQMLSRVEAAIPADGESPTQFEVLTAAAWLYFASEKVDVAVIEVGLGGRLDATNVCAHPLATVITSISWEHWQRLGNTLAAIASEKAGILKPKCPVVVGQLPESAMAVVKQKIAELECPAVFPPAAVPVSNENDGNHPPLVCSHGISYRLPLLGDMQRSNAALAIATLQILRQQGWTISDTAIAEGMAKTRLLGRIQWVTYQQQSLLVDGAHNREAATALRGFIDQQSPPSVSWVMGMLSTKDHEGIFQTLLRPGDRLFLVPVPAHSSASPSELAALAQQIQPQLRSVRSETDLFPALSAATASEEKSEEDLVVLCGSLYLLGYFFSHLAPPKS
ncbi:folylpolyglutamate synthase/dihydrofolate synthase family protein [Geitlerinema sp. PCC 9228]|jgi:dihydrofolate synthase/folylpolyglutamate synthase|uniref:bifunctional folylpolyglutamate synthase/dihydrofolate synthase n=1 Tax=Geitlerinema sp. PCC 9228 TaxID=111611 RepID=UPI0008F9AEFB|nr:folylpolyglutamate synthase/dihydrofolate synthase family protein [Geitlerinema sp. PCC 9228]